MKVLIACEESQAVCKAFRAKGHEAYSCDIQECSGGHPEWHIQGDCLGLLNGGVKFTTADGAEHEIEGKWDLLIAHPPCTYLTVTGNRWFNVERYGDKAIQRIQKREEAVDFFMQFVNADCERIAIENPVGTISSRYRKPDCIISPHQHGDKVRKKTCLWLKNLSPLVPTNVVVPDVVDGYSGPALYARDENGKILRWNDPRTAKIRSKTYDGVARAMAEQWGGLND